MTRMVYVAIWYDPQKVEARAIEAGWNPNSGDGFLDIYFPDDDPAGHEEREFAELDAAVSFLQRNIREGKDFWRQAKVEKYEVGGKRCDACTCRGWKHVHTYVVEDPEGIVEDRAEDGCHWEDN